MVKCIECKKYAGFFIRVGGNGVVKTYICETCLKKALAHFGELPTKINGKLYPTNLIEPGEK